MTGNPINVAPGVLIPRHELQWRASRSSGPGGQHVNTSSSRVELVWDVATSTALDEAQRTRLLRRLASRLDSTGKLRITAQDERSQMRNRMLALERFVATVSTALKVPKARRATKPTAASDRARLDAKRRRSRRKRERRSGGD